MTDPAIIEWRPGDPYAVPVRRKPSEGTHLVSGVRAAVDAWRANGYPGPAGPPDGCSVSGSMTSTARRTVSPFASTSASARRSRPSSTWRRSNLSAPSLTCSPYASRQDPIQPDETRRARLAFKMATGSGKTMAMSLCIAWSYFHYLRETRVTDDVVVPRYRAQHHRL